MRLLLINSPEGHQGGASNPVLGLLYLASYVRDICDVRYIDGFLVGWQGIEDAIKKLKPDFVGTSILTPARHASLRILKMAKELGAITIAGGPHVSIMYKQILEHYPYVDYVVKGEGEASLKKILLGQVPKGLVQSEELDINSIPYPQWSSANLDSNRYIGGADIRIPIIASRGCTGHCAFCSTWKHWKGYRVRSAEDVVGEIRYIVATYNKKHFVFEDDSLSCNLPIAKEILKLIIKENFGIRFFATMRADGIDEELVTLLKQAGCYGVSIGFESGSQRILDIMKKNTTVEQNIKAAQFIKKAGLSLCSLMIINSVGENTTTRLESQRFLDLIQPDNRGYLCEGLWILPGTYFYDKMKEKGFINDDFWLGPQPCAYYKGELDNLYG